MAHFQSISKKSSFLLTYAAEQRVTNPWNGKTSKLSRER